MPVARVLVVHNRYRIEGGEERSVELQLRALRRAGVEHRLLERRSTDVGRARAAVSLLRGGDRPARPRGRRPRSSEATVVHVHNMQPLVGPRGLAAARSAGARVVLHLHNLRLFCAIAVAARDGGPCFRCHGRNTLPGAGAQLPRLAARGGGLRHRRCRRTSRPCSRPSTASSPPAAGPPASSRAWACPPSGSTCCPTTCPREAVADRSHADRAEYALVASRLSPEKGLEAAVEAAAETGVPLRVAGEGPERERLERRARELRAPVTFLGRVSGDEVARLLAGAGALLLPSRYHEFSPYAVLEAMAAGVPVLGVGGGRRAGADRRRAGAAPRRHARRSPRACASCGPTPTRRRAEGDALIARVRENHSEERLHRAAAVAVPARPRPRPPRDRGHGAAAAVGRGQRLQPGRHRHQRHARPRVSARSRGRAGTLRLRR